MSAGGHRRVSGAVARVGRFPVMPSSVIRQFSYDEAGRRLTITFTSGDVYAYLGVPPENENGEGI